MKTENVTECGKPINFTGSGSVKGSGRLLGFFVSAASATPVLTIATKKPDTANTAVNLVNAIVPTVGFWACPFEFFGDLTVTISGTVDVTLSVVQ